MVPATVFQARQLSKHDSLFPPVVQCSGGQASSMGLELPPRLPSEFFGNFKKIIMCNSKSTPTKTSPENITLFHLPYLGSRDGTVVKALAPHQCGPGSIPGLDVISGLSLLLVLVLAPRVFLRVLRSSSLHKNQHFQIPISSGIRGPQVCQSSDC